MDAAGEPVLDLTVDEFVVQQNRAACEIVALQPETNGMKIAVLLDASGKVEAGTLRRGLDDFLDTLPGEHEIGLFTIVNQVVRRTDFTADRDQLRQAVSDLHAIRNTGVKLAEGLIDTWRRFDEADAWPVFVLVVHDGADLSPVHIDLQLRPLQSELIRRGATVHSVVVSPAGVGMLTALSLNMTRATGGWYRSIAVRNALPRAMTDLARTMGEHYGVIGHSYRVAFACAADGSEAETRVNVVRPGVTSVVFDDRRLP